MPRGGGGGSSSSSHGGFSSHTHSSGSSGSHSSSGSSFHGSYSGHSSSGSSYQSHHSSSYGTGYHGYHHGQRHSPGGYYRGGSYNGGSSGCLGFSGCGCLGVIVIVVIVLSLLTVLFAIANELRSPSSWAPSDSGIQRSTVERDKLPANECHLIDTWYQDDWGDWMVGKEGLLLMVGLREFYELTGVQPYLWITGEDVGRNYPNADSLEKLAMDRYDELFDDRGHLLVIFREYPNASGNYISACYAGASAETVLDAEAREILLDYIDYYYENDSLSDGEFFAAAFSEAAKRMMSVSRTTRQILIRALTIGGIVLGVIILIIVIIVALVKRRKRDTEKEKAKLDQMELQAKLEAEYTTIDCPHCGAAVRLRRGTSERCPYCHQYVTVSKKEKDPFSV